MADSRHWDLSGWRQLSSLDGEYLKLFATDTVFIKADMAGETGEAFCIV